MKYSIIPVSKPRQTRSDKWKERPCVMRYRAFADEVRLNSICIPDGGSHITFYIPMPKSWSKKKKASHANQPHKQKPDSDNLIKALFDAAHKEDSFIYDFRATKLWAVEGAIEVVE